MRNDQEYEKYGEGRGIFADSQTQDKVKLSKYLKELS